MAQLLGIRVQNYKALADVTVGQIDYGQGIPMPGMSCFIGENGCGKSTFLDAFGFLADCLREGVEAACDKPQRGGFRSVRTQGEGGAVTFTLYYRQDRQSRPIQYTLAIDERDGLPVVVREILRQRRKGQKSGRPLRFLDLENGAGTAWSGESYEGEESANKVRVELDDLSRPGITTLGQLKEHERIVGLRNYIEGWYLSYFLPDAARVLPPVGAQKHLDRTGANLGNYVQYLERSHAKRLRDVLTRIAMKIPGLRDIKPVPSPDHRLLLQFDEQGYGEPFYQRSMSDGTLKMFAYLLLLADPEPSPFIGIEEPENGLYHKLLDSLAREFVRHVEEHTGQTQMLVTTHSPWFVDALKPDQVWVMRKETTGRVTVRRAADIPTIQAMVDQGIPLGSLWYSNHLNAEVGP